MQTTTQFTLAFNGAESEQHLIDFYDVSQALIGFQRSLALTTHLVLNGEIITQSPSLKGATIFALPPVAGSWKIKAAIVTTAATVVFKLGTAEQSSPIGHLVYSLYDYVISQSLGVHVDYEKSLGVLYEEAKKNKTEHPKIKKSQAESLIEKCSHAIQEMHRPIYKSRTATNALVTCKLSGTELPLSSGLDLQTFQYIHETNRSNATANFEGRISSYNSNTFKGRIFIESEQRPIPFELAQSARSSRTARIVTTSLGHNALKQYDHKGSLIYVRALQDTSKTGLLKNLIISEVSDLPLTSNSTYSSP